ncbi:MAG TPA: hypothetical protein VK563_22455 [Puia sp.]|nr:hypothetical protein [Puia sp.]
MFTEKKYHIDLGPKLLAITVYFFLFTIQGDCRPLSAAVPDDPSSLTYGVEHLPVYKNSEFKKLPRDADKRDHGPYFYTICSVQIMPDPGVLAIYGKLGSPDPAPVTSDQLTATPRGPPCA